MAGSFSFGVQISVPRYPEIPSNAIYPSRHLRGRVIIRQSKGHTPYFVASFLGELVCWGKVNSGYGFELTLLLLSCRYACVFQQEILLTSQLSSNSNMPGAKPGLSTPNHVHRPSFTQSLQHYVHGSEDDTTHITPTLNGWKL